MGYDLTSPHEGRFTFCIQSYIKGELKKQTGVMVARSTMDAAKKISEKYNVPNRYITDKSEEGIKYLRAM